MLPEIQQKKWGLSCILEEVGQRRKARNEDGRDRMGKGIQVGMILLSEKR